MSPSQTTSAKSSKGRRSSKNSPSKPRLQSLAQHRAELADWFEHDWADEEASLNRAFTDEVGHAPVFPWSDDTIDRLMAWDETDSPSLAIQGMMAMVRLEEQLATVVHQLTGSPSPAASDWAQLEAVLRDVKSWLKTNISGSGVFVFQPEWTLPLALRLARLAWVTRLEDGLMLRGERLVTLLSQLARLACADGWLHPPSDLPANHQAFPTQPVDTLLRHLFDEKKWRPWKNVLQTQWDAQPPENDQRFPSVEAGYCCEASQQALLRRDWLPGANALTIDFSRADWNIRGTFFDQLIFQGPWKTEIVTDGRSPKKWKSWELICWFSDADGEYLEMSTELPGGRKLERQCYLARQIPLLWTSDTLHAPNAKELGLTWKIPLAGDPGLVDFPKNRTLELSNVGLPFRILPVGDPYTKNYPAMGTVQLKDNHLEITRRSAGPTLFLPMVWYWQPRKSMMSAPTDWRQLAITRDRELLAPDAAVAFRALIDDLHFVFFRALHPPGNMLYMGHYTEYECEIGQFTTDGKVDTWLRVESPPEEA